MKVEGRRESSNIRDNRGGVSKKAAAAGGGGVAVIALLIYFLTGQNVAPQLAQQQAQTQQCAGAECQLDAQAADSNTSQASSRFSPGRTVRPGIGKTRAVRGTERSNRGASRSCRIFSAAPLP